MLYNLRISILIWLHDRKFKFYQREIEKLFDEYGGADDLGARMIDIKTRGRLSHLEARKGEHAAIILGYKHEQTR